MAQLNDKQKRLVDDLIFMANKFINSHPTEIEAINNTRKLISIYERWREGKSKFPYNDKTFVKVRKVLTFNMNMDRINA